MEFNIGEKVNELIGKIKSDPGLAKEFKENPSKAIQKLTDGKVPADKIQPVIDGITAKLKADDITDKIGGLFKK